MKNNNAAGAAQRCPGFEREKRKEKRKKKEKNQKKEEIKEKPRKEKARDLQGPTYL